MEVTRALSKTVDRNQLIDTYSTWFVIIMSALVMFGWSVGHERIVSFKTGWVTMKFVTALCFFLVGLCMKLRSGKTRYIIMGFILSIVGITTLSVFVTPILNPFVFEDMYAINSIKADFPSWATILCFVLFVIGELFDIRKQTGWSIIVVAAVAMAGYFFDIHWLYFNVPHVSTAMAFHTALLFGHIGVWQVIYTKE